LIAPALIAALGLLLVLLLVRPPGWVMVLFLLVLFLPGRWWHWKTRRFRRGLRQVTRETNFRRVQPYFNLGRSYPYEVAARANLGVCDLQQGRAEAALERFRSALAEEPSWVPARYGEAVALKLLGQPDAAEASARQVTDLRPSYVAARLLLGSVLRESGRDAEAEEVLAPLVDDGRDAEALLQALEDRWGIGEM
jgi:tetratricopeptide (TPR) repeat protein